MRFNRRLKRGPTPGQHYAGLRERKKRGFAVNLRTLQDARRAAFGPGRRNEAIAQHLVETGVFKPHQAEAFLKGQPVPVWRR